MPPSAGACQTTAASLNPDWGRASSGRRSSRRSGGAPRCRAGPCDRSGAPGPARAWGMASASAWASGRASASGAGSGWGGCRRWAAARHRRDSTGQPPRGSDRARRPAPRRARPGRNRQPPPARPRPRSAPFVRSWVDRRSSSPLMAPASHSSPIHREPRAGYRNHAPSSSWRYPQRMTNDGVRPEHLEISQGGVESAEAHTITLTQGGISVATPPRSTSSQGGIARARATDIAVSQGGIGLAQGERDVARDGLDRCRERRREARVTQSLAAVVAGQDTTVDQIARQHARRRDRVTIRQPSAVLLLIAGRVEGSVRPLLDWRGGLAAGIGAALVLSLVRLVGGDRPERPGPRVRPSSRTASSVGAGTSVWHRAQVRTGATIGRSASSAATCSSTSASTIGDRDKIQNGALDLPRRDRRGRRVHRPGRDPDQRPLPPGRSPRPGSWPAPTTGP